MTLRTNHSYQDMCLGAFIGASVAVVAGMLMMGRKHMIPGYLHQSGEQSGATQSSVQEHDEKVFREELARAND